jgi:membrane-associated protein
MVFDRGRQAGPNTVGSQTPPNRTDIMHALLAASTLIPGFDLTALLRSAGPFALVIIAVLVFIENGLLFPFLPGDSLVFAAALLVVSLGIPLWLLILVAAAAAIAGDIVGYAIGARLGRRLFKPDAKIFKPKYRDQADAFLSRYGALALVLARFVPIVRTFVPPVVGTSSVPYRRFLLWNIVGGLAWAITLCLAGFWLGKIPAVANNVELIAVGIVVVSVAPFAVAFLRRRFRGPASEHRGTEAALAEDQVSAESRVEVAREQAPR